MKLYMIVRKHKETGKTEACVGSSLSASGHPYWGSPVEGATIQPLLFRSPEYAVWCRDIAQRKEAEHDGKELADKFDYGTQVVDFPDLPTGD